MWWAYPGGGAYIRGGLYSEVYGIHSNFCVNTRIYSFRRPGALSIFSVTDMALVWGRRSL
jgi:hypothetical protein